MYRRIRSPKQRFIRSFVSRQHFPAQRKGGGISKGGNPGSPLWLRAEGTHRTDYRLRKTNQTRKKLTITGATAATNIIFIRRQAAPWGEGEWNIRKQAYRIYNNSAQRLYIDIITLYKISHYCLFSSQLGV